MRNRNTTSQAVDDYIAKQNPEARQALEQLRACIRRAAPEATELINYQIPAFALVEGGKREQQIMIAGYGKHVGFYPHPDTIAAFVDRLAPYTFAKGSIRFPLNQPLPQELIVEMVRCRLSQLHPR